MQERPSVFHINLSMFELHLVYVFVCVFTRSVVSDSLQPNRLATRLLCPWNSPGKNTGVGLPFPSPVDFPNPRTELMYPALAGGFFTTEPLGKPLSVFIGMGNFIGYWVGRIIPSVLGKGRRFTGIGPQPTFLPLWSTLELSWCL